MIMAAVLQGIRHPDRETAHVFAEVIIRLMFDGIAAP
jgi:hypothetical protein